MRANEQISRKGKILIGVYSSSAGISMTALAIVAVLEVFMLVYSVLNAPMYGDYLWHYRAFYIALLAVALIYIALNAFVKRDIARRYKVLNVANPLYAVFFFGWALGITFFDSIIWGTADTMVFMTFSLVVPLSFFLFPWAYVAIVVVADALMMYLTVTVTGTVASLINLSIFCIFQIVLGFSFLRMRLKLAERIVQEQENADIDVLTGFANRRVYEQDMKKLSSYPGRGRMAYISIDVNGLKEINDQYGHKIGDSYIIGCCHLICETFKHSPVYRIGGDEFVVILQGVDYNNRLALVDRLKKFYEGAMNNDRAKPWERYSAAVGMAEMASDDRTVDLVFKRADKAMYKDKQRIKEGHESYR